MILEYELFLYPLYLHLEVSMMKIQPNIYVLVSDLLTIIIMGGRYWEQRPSAVLCQNNDKIVVCKAVRLGLLYRFKMRLHKSRSVQITIFRTNSGEIKWVSRYKNPGIHGLGRTSFGRTSFGRCSQYLIGSDDIHLLMSSHNPAGRGLVWTGITARARRYALSKAVEATTCLGRSRP
jgi:hypothetical protein